MQRNAYGRDFGLTVRMLFVSLVLAALYAVAGFLSVGLVVASPSNFVAWGVVFIFFGLLVTHYFTGDRLVLRAARARVIEDRHDPELHGMVDRLCSISDLPKPRLARVWSDVPNAFATGRSPRHATVVVTTGLTAMLDEGELEAVVAHELAHIANRDAIVMTAASYLQMWGAIFARRRWGREDFGKEDDLSERVSFALIKPFALVFYGFTTALTFALSRYREYAADRGAAVMTGAPEQLMSALQKIAGEVARIPSRDLRAMSGLNAFFIIPASLKERRFEFLMDHPPLEKRLRELSELSREMGRPVP